jgi:hypothetical protein
MNKSIRSICADDVFDLYKRNKRYYDDCWLAKKKCPSINEVCYCRFNVPVLPETIGDQYSSCHIRIKRYISPLEECSICLDKIVSEKNAYITNCGHAFHKSCLFKSYETSFLNHRPYEQNGIIKYFQFLCALCRKQIIYPEFYCKYPQWCYNASEKNYLDVLEEFWLSKDFTMVQICHNGLKNHSLGMNKNCSKCLQYRNI